MLPLSFISQERRLPDLAADSTNRVRRFSCRSPLLGITQIISRIGLRMASFFWSKGSESTSNLTQLTQISQISGTPLTVESIPMAISVVVIPEPSISTTSEISVLIDSQPVLETISEVPPQSSPLASIEELLRAFACENVYADSLLTLLKKEISVLDSSIRSVPSKELFCACALVIERMKKKEVKFNFIEEQEKGLIELLSLVLRYCRVPGNGTLFGFIARIQTWIKHVYFVAGAAEKHDLIWKIFSCCDTNFERNVRLDVLWNYRVSIEHILYDNFLELIWNTLLDIPLPKNWELQFKTFEIYQEAKGLNLPVSTFPSTFEHVPEGLIGLLLQKMNRFGRPMLVCLASMGVFLKIQDISKDLKKFLTHKEFKEGKNARKLIILFKTLKTQFKSIDDKELQQIYECIVPLLLKQTPAAALKLLESMVLLAQIGLIEVILAYKESDDLEPKINEFFKNKFKAFKPDEILKRYPALKVPLLTYYTVFQRDKELDVEFAESAAYRAFLGEWHTFLDILIKKSGAFSDWRYDLKDAHMEKLHRYFTSGEEEDKWNIWKCSQIVRKPGGKLQGVFAGEKDQEIVPFFFVGRDIGSCQDYAASFDLSRSLLGYMHGKCLIAGVWDETKQRWLARRILRVLFSEKNQKPLLVLEKLYGEPNLDKEIVQSALDRAKELDLPLYATTSSVSDQIICSETSLEERLESYGGRQFEYVDSSDGLQSSAGRYTIEPSRFSQILSVKTSESSS